MTAQSDHAVIAAMHAEIAALRAQMSGQAAEITALRRENPESEERPREGTSRRILLKRLAIGAAGIAAARTVGGTPQGVAAFTGSTGTVGWYAHPGSFPASVTGFPTGSVGVAGSTSTDYANTTGTPFFNAGVYGTANGSGNEYGMLAHRNASPSGSGAALSASSIGVNAIEAYATGGGNTNGVLGTHSGGFNGGSGVRGETGTGGETDRNGVYGIGKATGTNTIGVRGESKPYVSGNKGVLGYLTGSTIGTDIAGVYGSGAGQDGFGVWGRAQTKDGVRGEATASGSGVHGSSASGYGVYGESTSATGVYGLSTSSYGGVFITSSTVSGQYGVLGGASGVGVAAFGGANSNAGGYAAYFTGNVKITGGKLFLDGQTLQSLHAHTDGTKRATYGVQASESMLEDMGEATLANGKAEVKLDPAFAGLIATDRYLVFLTGNDGTGALRVARRTAAGFAVEEIGAVSSGMFAWRVVARPRDAGKAQRLAKHDLADLTVPSIEALMRKPTPGTDTSSAPSPAPSPGGTATPTQPAPTATAAPPTASPPTAQPGSPTTGGQAPNPAPPPRTP